MPQGSPRKSSPNTEELGSVKHILCSTDPARIGLAQSLLDAADIEWDVRNQAVSQAEIGLPFATELWVLRDEDYEAARRSHHLNAPMFQRQTLQLRSGARGVKMMLANERPTVDAGCASCFHFNASASRHSGRIFDNRRLIYASK